MSRMIKYHICKLLKLDDFAEQKEIRNKNDTVAKDIVKLVTKHKNSLQKTTRGFVLEINDIDIECRIGYNTLEGAGYYRWYINGAKVSMHGKNYRTLEDIISTLQYEHQMERDNKIKKQKQKIEKELHIIAEEI